MVRLLVVDTETGGVDPEAHSILSFAGVVWNDGKIEAELDLRIVEPLLTVTVQAMQINRINLVDHAVGAVTPQEAAKRLATFLRRHFGDELKTGGKVALAGHNVGFDIGFLKRLCRLGGISFNELFSHRSLDTSSILRFMGLAGRAPLQGAGLEEALQHFQIVIPQPLRHTALGDARGTAELLNKLISLERVVDVQDKRLTTTGRETSRPRTKPGAKKATAPATTVGRRTRR